MKITYEAVHAVLNPKSEIIKGYQVVRCVLVGDLVFKFGHNPEAVEPYVTWCGDKDDPTYNNWGHYFIDKDKAVADFFRRIDSALTCSLFDHTIDHFGLRCSLI